MMSRPAENRSIGQGKRKQHTTVRLVYTRRHNSAAVRVFGCGCAEHSVFYRLREGLAVHLLRT